jgi:hypothetical protein
MIFMVWVLCCSVKLPQRSLPNAVYLLNIPQAATVQISAPWFYAILQNRSADFIIPTKLI